MNNLLRRRWLISPWFTVGFVGGLILIIAVAVYSYRRTKEQVATATQMGQIHEIIRATSELRASLEEEQSDHRGFLITGDEAFRQLSAKAASEALKDLRELRELTTPCAKQQAQFAILEKLIDERREFSLRMIDLRRAGGLAEATQQTDTNRIITLSDQIRANLGDMMEDERRLLAVQQAAVTDAAASWTVVIQAGGLFLGLVLLILIVLRLNDEMTTSQQRTDTLRKNEEMFHALFENAGDAIFLMQGDRFIDCNARTLEMFGCKSRDQIVGHPPYEFSSLTQPGGRDSHDFAIEKITAALAGQPQFFEWRHTKLDGTAFPAEVSLNTVTVDGKVLLQAIVRDITGRKQAEEAQRKATHKRQLHLE